MNRRGRNLVQINRVGKQWVTAMVWLVGLGGVLIAQTLHSQTIAADTQQTLEPTVIGIYFLSPSSGATGTVVDIRGYGFSATPVGNQVSFNGHTAVVLTATTDSLRTIVPAVATSGPVTVTNANGTAVSSQTFIVLSSSSLAPSLRILSAVAGDLDPDQ